MIDTKVLLFLNHELSMINRLNILWLPAWYPSKIDFLPGDFIDRHAKATSIYANVIVLFVAKDLSLPKNKSYIDLVENNGLFIYRAYYNCSHKFGGISKLLSLAFYYYLLIKTYKAAKAKHIGFDLAHVHVVHKQGLLALYLKWKNGLKYIISEHSSWFTPLGKHNFPTSYFVRHIIKQTFKNADEIHVVSAYLGNLLKDRYPFLIHYTVIPNVVDTSVFYPSNTSTKNSNVFLAITGNTFHKNTDGLLRAFAHYLEKGYNGILQIVGPNTEALKHLTEELSITNFVVFRGSVSNEIIAELMRQVDVLVFFSRYETFGCVMAEAFCCGKPVIASDLEVIHENLKEYENGLFVTPEDEDDLTNKMILFTQQTGIFNHQHIANDAINKFNYNKVGSAFLSLYTKILQS